MRILKLTLQGFKSYAKEVTIDFAGRKGLIYVTGENQAEPALGRNGTGKSTIFEGLFWMLYGKTSRNLKAGAVATWGSNVKCKGSLFFENNGHTYNLLRTWSPNKLFLSIGADEGRDIDQQELENVIGYGPDLFLHSIYHAQSAKMFLDLSPSDQLALFSDALNLSVWERASETASHLARDKESRAAGLRSALDRGIGQLQSLGNEIADLEDDQHLWERERYRELLKRHGELNEAKRALATGKKKLVKAADADTEELAKAEGRLDRAQDMYVKAVAEYSKVEAAVSRLTREAADLKRQRREFESNDEAVCSRCGQSIPRKEAPAHLASEADRIAGELDALFRKERGAQKAVAAAREAFDNCKDAVGILREEQETSEAAVLRRSIDELSNEIARAEQELVSIAQEAWRHDDKLQRRTKEYAVRLQDVNEAKADIKRTLGEAEGFKHWVKGFKEVRLFLIEESLAQLEVETNACLYDLGLEEWAIEFAVEGETKGGTIKKGFTANIRSPHNEEVVPWEAWSGGEAQRLRLAMAMGMSSLIATQTGIMSNIEIWDEPCQHLSEEGISGLLTALETRAAQTGRQIWIVEHHALDFGRFADVVKVTKTAAGSTLV